MTLEERSAHCLAIIRGYEKPEQIRRVFGCIQAAIAEEREACAKVAEECLAECWPLEPRGSVSINIPDAIRARGTETPNA